MKYNFLTFLFPVLITVLLTYCSSNSEEKKVKPKFYTDFEIFQRKGIGETNRPDTLTNYFEWIEEKDNVIFLNLHIGKEVRKLTVPRDNRTVYSSHNPRDESPRYIFAKIEGDSIIRFKYFECHPDKFKSLTESRTIFQTMIAPMSIDIIKKDTLYNYSPFCFNGFSYKDIPSDSLEFFAIRPFNLTNFNFKCSANIIHFYDKNGELKKIFNLNSSSKENNITKGAFNHKLLFKHWRFFHDLERAR